MKYKIGDYVSKPVTGVCRVEDILRLDKIGIQNEKLYYLLIPVDDKNEKIYVPVGSAEEKIRACLTSEEAWKLIEQIPRISEIWIGNEKMKEQKYKEAIRTNRPEALVSVIKRIYQQKQRRREQGKKTPSSDERYFQLAENLLYAELGCALQKSKQDICQLIIDYADKGVAADHQK